MNASQGLAIFAIVSLTASLAAQIVTTPCCKEVREFEDDGETPPCTGGSTTVCDKAPTTGGSQDFGILRPALCKTYVLTSGTFVQDPCAATPGAGWKPLGEISDGVCCYYFGNVGIVETLQGFSIRSCGGRCVTGIH